MNIEHLTNINSLQTFIFWFFGVIGILIIKFLSWIMPKTFVIICNHIKDSVTKEIREELHALRGEIKPYKEEKHEIKGENLYLKEAIVSEDREILKEVRKVLKKQQNEKK